MGVEPPYVDYDSFELDPAVSGADFSIVAYMLSRYYSAPRATRLARSCASSAAQIPPSAVLTPHGFATLPEAQAFIASRGENAVSSTYFRMRGNPRASTGEQDVRHRHRPNGWKYFEVPGVDTKALLESHDRNIEALTRATEVATEGAAAVYRRQQEIMQANAMVRDIKLGSEQQAGVAKKVFEQALANARELAEMSAKANQDAYEVMKKRLQTSIEEMKAVFAKRQG